MLSVAQLLALYCHVDDFYRAFEPSWRAMQLMFGSAPQRKRARSLSPSEIMTILIAFHQSHYRDFKTFYLGCVCQHWRREFPRLVSYTRFMDYIASIIAPLFAYLRSLFGSCTGISFVDSTDLAVCHNKRIAQHKVFKGVARRGKTSTGWFFGFKLHLLVSERGELLNIAVTSGEVDDRKPVPQMVSGAPSGAMHGRLFGDKGYIYKELFDDLLSQGVLLITKAKKNMKPRLMLLTDRLLLRKRAIIETIIDQLKNVSQIEHTRHRAYSGFLWNLAAGLIAYCHQDKKPALNLRPKEQLALDYA